MKGSLYPLLVLAALTGCIDYLDPGEVGAVRYFGEVRYTPGTPLPLLPPIADRDGNAYVLSGSRDLRQVTAFTGQAGGGWSSGCALHKGDDRGAHGWIGRGAPLTDAEAFTARILLIHHYRRVVLRDPLLPSALLPGDWPGRAARKLCGEIYRGLLPASEQWLDRHASNENGVLPKAEEELARRFAGA